MIGRIVRAVTGLGIASLLLVATAGLAAAAKPAGTTPGVWAWVTARHPLSAEYEPHPGDRGNSEGAMNSVRRIGVGDYGVRLDRMQATCAYPTGCEGHVQIAAVNTKQRLCLQGDMGHLGTDDIGIQVQCFDRRGRPAESAFSLV